MKLEELTAGTPITLIAKIGEEQLEFHSTVQETYPKKKFILADPVYRDEKIISFSSPGITVDLLVSLDKDKPQIFQKVVIMTMKKPDKSLCYSIAATSDSKGINRRGNFRCFIGTPTTIKCGIEQDLYDAILRDVSISGFSVTVDSDLGITENQVIHAMLEDYIEELNENFSFHLYGLVVRIQELDNGKIVYGCRLNNKIGGLENYIMKKERIRLRKSNGGGSKPNGGGKR